MASGGAVDLGQQIVGYGWDLAKVLGGALAGAYFVHRKTRNDLLYKYIDDVERSVRDFADSAGRYWSLSASHEENSALEVKLRQLSQRIAGELRYICKEFPQCVFSQWIRLKKLRVTATGGDFGRITRGPDQYRAKDIEDAAGELIHAIREMRPKRRFF